jgi:hypothetical protein
MRRGGFGPLGRFSILQIALRGRSTAQAFGASRCQQGVLMKGVGLTSRRAVPGKPNDDLAPGTQNSILEQAGLK